MLTYHRIEGPGDRFPGLAVDVFREQMRWVAARCHPIAPERLQAMATESRRDRPAVLITFDDGYLSYRQHGYPVLKELGIPALVFLATGYVDDPTRLFWWDALRAGIMGAVSASVAPPWAPTTTFRLADRADREGLLRAAKDHLKGVPNDRREIEVAALLERLGTSAEALRGKREMMDWDDVRAVMDLTRLGGHTHTHPILSMLPDEGVESEVAICRERIESATGLRPRFFAYPNGRTRDFDERSRAALWRHGFDTAFSTEEGTNGPDADWMALRRFSGDSPLPELAWRLSARARR